MTRFGLNCRWMMVVVALGLGACGKKKDKDGGGGAAGGGGGTATPAPSGATPSGSPAASKAGPAQGGGAAPAAGKTDPALEAAIRAVVAGCTIDNYGSAKDCKADEHTKAKEAIKAKTPWGSLETFSVLAHDPDETTRRYLAGLAYDTISSHIGYPYFYQEAKSEKFSNDIALRFIAALNKYEGQPRFYLAPTIIHAAVLTKNVPALEAEIAKAKDNQGLLNEMRSNLMVFGRMEFFDKLVTEAAEATKADDANRVISAIEAVHRIPEPTADEDAKVCPWALGYLSAANLRIAGAAAGVMIHCKGEYIDKLMAEGEARVAAGTFDGDLAMAFREICFTPIKGTGVQGEDAQCAKNFAFLEAVGTNKALPGKVRGRALWNIYYQRRDRATLDLLRKYEKEKDADLAKEVRDAIRSLRIDYQIDDGKPVPQEPVTWSTTAAEHQKEVGKTFTYDCPPGGSPSNVYGTGTYTYDSSVCSAAVHMGKLKADKGGKVKIEIMAGGKDFVGSEKNGVKSSSWSSSNASFKIK